MIAGDQDTICAIATPSGRSGVGIVRVSGASSGIIAEKILGFKPKPRHAHYCPFYDQQQQVIDQGIALFFPGPNSFTGEDVLELQGHGGTFILDSLLQTLLARGCRLARPGEFSERAFLNDKLDLAQAEAIADLINASSAEAARSAVRTLQGDFSRLIERLSESIVELRVYVEAAIDFTDEEIDFLSEGRIGEKLTIIANELDSIIAQAHQGALLRDGMQVVIAGRPNAGKSSLLNALSGSDKAIVTDIEGTTRDILSEQINLDGMPLHVTDTAGLRDSDDIVEQEGIKRAQQAIEQADQVLLMIDSQKDAPEPDNLDTFLATSYFSQIRDVIKRSGLTLVYNKIDLSNESPAIDVISQSPPVTVIRLSAKTGPGMDLLKNHLKSLMGYRPDGESGFIARRRHIDALQRAQQSLAQAIHQLADHNAAELVAEDLRLTHRHLGEITGEFTADDLLGRIFSSFCIGK